METTATTTIQSDRQGLSEVEFSALVKDHGRFVYRFILRKLRNPSDAEDLYQSALCEAFRARDTFMWQSKPQTWLCGIAFNLVRNFYARNKNNRISFDSEDILEDTPAEDMDPADIFARNEITKAIAQHMAAMPDVMRKTLTLVAEQNHSYEEAAQALGVPIGTIRSRIFRARAYLTKFGSHDLLTAN